MRAVSLSPECKERIMGWSFDLPKEAVEIVVRSLIQAILREAIERVAKWWRNRSATKSESLQEFEKFTGR